MEENKYRTSGVIDESTYQEIGKIAMNRKYIWFTRIAAVVMMLLAALMLIAQNKFYMVLCLVLAVFFALCPRRILKKQLKVVIKRMQEAYPSGSMQMETWFTGEGVAVHNLTDGGQIMLPYGTLQRVAETERYFYLVTKATQFTLVFKDLLTPEERKAFLPFVQGKCPDIKVVR